MGKREKRNPASAAATDSSGSQQNMSVLSKGKREYLSIKGKSRAIVLVEYMWKAGKFRQLKYASWILVACSASRLEKKYSRCKGAYPIRQHD